VNADELGGPLLAHAALRSERAKACADGLRGGG
jgi:hypothetical protein